MNLLEYFYVLVKWRKVIYLNVIAVTLVSVVLSFTIPKNYTSTTSFIPSASLTMPTASTTQAFQLYNYLGLSPSGTPFGGFITISDIFAGFLTKTAVLEKVIQKADIMKIKGIKELKKAMKWLIEHSKVSTTPEGIISISVSTDDPYFSSKIGSSYISALQEVGGEFYFSYTRWKTQFLKEAVENAKTRALAAAESLKKFQKKHNIYNIDQEFGRSFTVYTQLKEDEIKAEIEIMTMKKYTSPDNPQLKKLEEQLSNIRRKLIEMEKKGISGSGFGTAFGAPLSKISDIEAEFQRRVLERDAQNNVYAFLLREYEKAKVEEGTNVPILNILEQPEPLLAEKSPKKVIFVLIFFAFSFFFSIFLAFYFEFLENIETSPKFSKLKELLSLVKKDFSIRKKQKN